MLPTLSETQWPGFLDRIREAARRVLKDDARADDARQDAALALLEGKTPTEPVRNVAGFAAAVGRNQGLDQARKSRRRKTVPLTEAVAGAARQPSPASKLSRSEESARLDARLAAELSPLEREVLALRAREKKSVDDCAIRLGVPKETVNRAYFRAKTKARRLACGGKGGDDAGGR